MSAELRLLVVEDESHLAAGLKLNFSLEGYTVDVAATGRDAARLLASPTAYAAIILDVMLPDLDGFALCRKIRAAGNYTPVIMLTARDSSEDRVEGLEAGADDYLVKPFHLDELLARVRSQIRRAGWGSNTDTERDVVRFGAAVVDLSTLEARVNGELIHLTRLEFDLIGYLASHAGRVVPRKELLEKVWKLRNYPNTRTVDNFIARLRRHFEPVASRPVHFVSVRGAGYKFVPEGDGR